MASHPFRTVRPTGSPSAGGSIHTLGAHLADNTPHPQFVKKGEKVGGGNISAHEANRLAHLRYYLSRDELCLDLLKFITTLDLTQIASNGGYSVDKVQNTCVVTPYILKLALADPTVLESHFGHLLNRTDIVVNRNGETQSLDGSKDAANGDKVPSYLMFDLLSTIVASMLYGTSPSEDSILYRKVVGKNISGNPLTSIFSRIGHTHDTQYADKKHTHDEEDIVFKGTGVDGVPPIHPAREDHTHPEYITREELTETELTRENLREVGIYEQSVVSPKTYANNEFDLNRYCTQGNYTFAISKADLIGEDGNFIRSGHFPEIYIGAIEDGGLAGESINDEVDVIATNAILNVTASREDLAALSFANISSRIQDGTESSQFKTVLQLLSTNSPVKRNAYSSSLSDKIETYKDLSRKLYSRTGYSLDYAWYISSVIGTVFDGISPEQFYTYKAGATNVISAVAESVNSRIDTFFSKAPPYGIGVGYIKYNYKSPYDEARIRLAPELTDLFHVTSAGEEKVPVFAQDTGFFSSINSNILSRDASGWILDGYYKRIVPNGGESLGSAYQSVNVAEAMMPINGTFYAPYLNYFTTEYSYIAANTTDSIIPSTAYFDGNASNERITSSFDTSTTVEEDSELDAPGEFIKLETGAEASYPSAGFSTSDPYLYEFRKITVDAYSGLVWSNPSSTEYSPLYIKTPSANVDEPDTFTEVFGTAGSSVFRALTGHTVSDENRTYVWNPQTKVFNKWDIDATYDAAEVFYEYTGVSVLGESVSLYKRCYVTDDNGSFRWNKILLDRSEAYNITSTFRVYAFDLVVHKFVDVSYLFELNNNIVPARGSSAFNEYSHECNLYTDAAINVRNSYYGKITPEPDQYVLPKILGETRAVLGVGYVKFTGSDVSKFQSAPDYTTGFTFGSTIVQNSFIQCSEEDKDALQVELGIQVSTPTNVVDVIVYNPDKLDYETDLEYDSTLTYLRKASEVFTEITNISEIADSNGLIIPSVVENGDVYTMPKNESGTIYVIPGTVLSGGGVYGVKLPRYAKSLINRNQDVYTRAFFYMSPDTILRDNKKYYYHDNGTGQYEEITTQSVMDYHASRHNVYESLTMEDFFDIWCAIRQLTTVGATNNAPIETGSDPLVYNFDSNGELITWDAWQELVTHGDPSFATFESRTGKFLRLTDELLPKINLVESALDSSIDSNGFGYALKTESSPVAGRRYYTKSGNVYTEAGIGGDTLTAFASGTTYWINKYDAALDKAFKHARWLASLTESEATLWLGLGTSTANSSSGTTIRLKWKSGSTDVVLANLADLDKYATGKWVLDLQSRISDLEAADPSRESYTVTYDSIPVNGRKYYTKSGDVYTLAGIGQDTLMSFSSGITYYVSTSLSARMNELEAIWEWFENNVRSGGGSLVVNATTTDVCIDAFLNYDSEGHPITRGTVVNLNPRSPNGGYVLVPTSEVNNGIRVDTNLSGDMVTIDGVSYTRVKIIDVDENGYSPYQFSVILKCDDNVSGSQNKVIENPVAEILIPDSSHPGEYQGAMYVPASSLLWTVTSGTNQGIWFKVPQSWVDLYNLGTDNSTYHVYLRKRFYGTSMTVGISRANKLVSNRAGS